MTRSGTRRQGDEYQDTQALDILVEWLGHRDRYQWVRLEDAEGGFLDDIAAMRADGVLEVWQVKFSTTTHMPDDAWTWDVLLEQKAGAAGQRLSLLQKWFGTWQRQVSASPGLRSNRRAAPELCLDSPRRGRVLWNELAEAVRQRIVAQLGDEAQARAFFDAFYFRVDEPSLRELKDGAWENFERLGGTQEGWNALEKAVREWTNTKDNPPPDGSIHLDEIYRVTGLKDHPIRFGTFFPPPVFFGRYMEPGRLFHHRLPMVGRRAQLNDLLSFVNGSSRLAILPGRGGSGKSKLLLSLCRRLRRTRPDLRVRLLAEKLTVTKESLEELPDNTCLVIVDDAHDAVGLEVLLEAAQQNPGLKLLLATRPHAKDYLVAQARTAGFDRNEINVKESLPKLNYAREHLRLARLVLGREWAHYADQLASVTRDSPYLTVLGGELLRTEQVAPSFLTRDETFRREVLSRFRDIQFGLIISHLDGRFTKELCAAVLPLIAVLTPFDLDNAKLLQSVAHLSGTDEVKLRQLLDALVKGEALVQGSRMVRIVPDVLSDFILQEACLTDYGAPTGWATQVYREVADFRLDTVLHNLAQLDWRVRTARRVSDASSAQRAGDESGLLDYVWCDIEGSFRASSLSERRGWLKRLESMASMQPHRLWPIVEIALNEPALEGSPEIASPLKPWDRPTTQADLLAALVPVLRGVAHDERFTARCAEHLWTLGRDLEAKPGHTPSAIEALRGLASYEGSKPLSFNHIILERCREWMKDPNIHSYRHSVLEVLSPLLARQAYGSGAEGRWLSHGSFPLPPEPFRELRQGALELVECCARSGERRVVLKALRALHTTVTEEGLWGLRKEDLDEWQWWEWEVLAALEIVARLAQSNSDPFVRLRIWEDLHLQAERGPRPVVQRRAREILDSIPHSFESRFILLVTGNHGFPQYRQTWANPEEDENWLKADQAKRLLIDEKRYRRNEEFARNVTREWYERYPDPREGFDTLDIWMEQIETSGWWDKLWTRSNPFILQLAADHLSYARAWCEIALEKPEARPTVKCDDLLCELRRQDPEGTLELVQRFMAHGHPNLWLRVAGSYSWRGWPSDPLPGEWQIVRDLLAFPHPQVKRRAAEIVTAVASTDMRRAVELVLETDVGEDSELANGLFTIFEERGGFDFSEITSGELARLLNKLRMVEDVRPYHLGRFLLQAALRDPIAVAGFLLDRVRRKAKLDEERWEKVATDFHLWASQVDSYHALPESGFHDDRFQEVSKHPDYGDALRLIRDAALNSDEYRSVSQYEGTISELFREFSLNYGAVALDILNEWINSGDCVKVRSAHYLLGDSYLGVYVNNLSFVSNYLHRARECGEAVLGEVERAMLHYAEYGPPRAMASRRGERSSALFHNALKALENVKDDPLVVHFFQRLRDRGCEMIQSEMRQDAEEEIIFRP